MTTGTSAKGKTAVSSLRDTEAAEATAPASTSDDNATPPPRPRHDRGRRPPFRSTSTDRSRTDMRANGTTFARDARASSTSRSRSSTSCASGRAR